MVDTHLHLFSEYYNDIDDVINRSIDSGVKAVVVNGTNINDNKEVLDLVKRYDCVYGALGIQPEEIEKNWEECFSFIVDHIHDDKIIAIGEIGLDRHYDNIDYELQKKVFRKQLELAEEYNIPVIVHSRDCIEDTYNILSEYNIRGILHCYSGSLEMAYKFIELGFYIGIGGISTFKNAKKIKEVIKNIEMEYILLETDAPYLSPEPYRGERNEPKNIPVILKEICAIKGIDFLDGVRMTTDNACHLFDKKMKI